MWMIRFIQYPRNSVENLHRALYIKLLKIQWLSDRKFIPFPAGKGRWKFPKSTRNENIKKILWINLFKFICFIYLYRAFVLFDSVAFEFSNTNTRRHPEPRIPPDSRSVQILYRISGMLNESNRCASVMVRFRIHYIVQMGIVSATLFLQSWLDIAQNPSSILSSPFG